MSRQKDNFGLSDLPPSGPQASVNLPEAKTKQSGTRQVPPTEPSPEFPPEQPYLPFDDASSIPPTDPGDELALIPPTDPGDELVPIPPTDPGDDLLNGHKDLDSDVFEQTQFPQMLTEESQQLSSFPLIPPTEPKLQKQTDVLNRSEDVDRKIKQTAWTTHIAIEYVFPLKSFFKDKWGTLSFLIAFVVIYMLTTGHSTQTTTSISDAIQWGANFAPKIKGVDFEWWRLLSAPYLHWDLSHITFNVGAFLLLASQFEHLLGSLALIGIFTTSSTLAGMATLYNYPNQVSMGASGGIYGIFGALLMLFLATQGQKVKFAKSITLVMLIWLIHSLESNFNSVQADNASHFGGLVSGFLLCYFLLPIPEEIKTKSQIKKLFMPVIFTGFLVLMIWRALPAPHPIFEVIEQYHTKAQVLHKYSQRFSSLSPLQQRALWEAEVRPILQTLTTKLLDSTETEDLVTRNEIKTVTHATQWGLKRLLHAWWMQFAAEFEAVPKSIQLTQKETLPSAVVYDLYETMLAKHSIAQIIEPSWDERIKSLEYYQAWQYLKEARKYLTQVCAELVAEASSVEVRALGSLWAQAEVRNKRLKLVEETLKQREFLNSTDIITLTQIKWLNAQIKEVIQLSAVELRKPIDQQVLMPEDQIKLAKLLYQAVLATPPIELDSELSFKLNRKGQIVVVKGFIPRQGQLFLSAQSCKLSAPSTQQLADEKRKQIKTRSKSKLDSQPHSQQQAKSQRFIIEIVPPLQPSSSQKDILNHADQKRTQDHLPSTDLTNNKAQAIQPPCLEGFKVLGWLGADTALKNHSVWRSYPLD